MNRKNLMALLGGLVLGVAGTQVFFYFRDRLPGVPAFPPVKPTFLATFDDDFRAVITRLRAAGVKDADLAYLVVAEFDRQLALKDDRRQIGIDTFEKDHTPNLQAGRRQAIESLLGQPAFSAWRRETVLRCLRPSELGLRDAGAEQLYRLWDKWDRVNLWPYYVTRPAMVPDQHAWAIVDLEQLANLVPHERQLCRLLGREAFLRYLQAQRIAGGYFFADQSALSLAEQERLYFLQLKATGRALRQFRDDPTTSFSPGFLRDALAEECKSPWERLRERWWP